MMVTVSLMSVHVFSIKSKLKPETKQISQSKSKTQITRMHGKFNCITVKYDGTRRGIYIILELHKKFNI